MTRTYLAITPALLVLWAMTTPTAAHATDLTTANGFFPLIPRVSALGLTGTDTVAAVDAMLPIFGDGNNTLVFIDGQAKTAFGSDWLASLGAGVRTIVDEQRIFGAYVFADRSVSTLNQDFWFVSPGVESLGQVWDFRANGYIPVSSQKVLTGTDFANTFGNVNYTQFSGHSQFDVMVDNYETVGWSVDAEVGRRIPGIPAARAYVGGYHVDPTDADAINGVAARLEYAVNSLVTVSARERYDATQHNTVEVGIQFNFGGVNRTPRDPQQPIRQRWLDPIERNLATLGQGTGAVVSSQQTLLNGGEAVLQRDNIWFFDAKANAGFSGVQSCTAELPCSSETFNQAVIDQINQLQGDPAVIPPGPTPWFYFRPGQYSAIDNGQPLVLTDDSLFSRNPTWQIAQRGAIFSGGFVVNGSSVFDAITLYNDPLMTQAQAILLTANGDLTLDNTVIGVDNDFDGQAYATGIVLSDSRLTLLNQSELTSFSRDGDDAIGIHAIDQVGSQIQISNSSVNAIVNGVFADVDYVGVGILAEAAVGAANTTSNILIDQNSSVTATAVGNFGEFDLNGVLASQDSNHLTIASGATVGANAKVNYANTINAHGATLIGTTNDLQLDQGTLNATANVPIGDTTVTTVTATGAVLTGTNNNITATNGSIITATASAADAQAAAAAGVIVNAQDAAVTTITLDQSQINATAHVDNLVAASQVYSVAAQGIFIDTTATSGTSSNTITLQNQSQLNVDSSVDNGNLATGYANSLLAEAINISSGIINAPTDNVSNTITLADQSAITVTAHLQQGAAFDPNTLTAHGIYLSGGANNSNTVTLNTANVQVNANLDNGGDYVNQVNSDALALSVGAGSSNTVSASNSTIAANGVITNGGNFSNGVSVTAINASAGGVSANTLTLDNTQLSATATLQQAGNDATNATNATGINADQATGGSVANNVTLQGTTKVNATATITNGGSGGSTNDANAEGLRVTGAQNTTTLTDSVAITAAANANGTAASAIAVGIESIAPLGPTNVVDNQVDPINNNNITALQNGVNNGQKIDQHP